jgi:membrane-bound lytic murein transglycosylase B
MMLRRLLPCLSVLALTACATLPRTAPPVSLTPDAPLTPATAAASASASDIPTQVPAAEQAAFVRDTAARFGIPAAQIEAVLARAQIREPIRRAMARPAEAKPWRDYRPIFIQPARIAGGCAFLRTHRPALQQAEDRYGVPKEIIVAILGVETGYGANQGSWPVLDALYTLGFAYPRSGDPARAAYEDKRQAFFRDELAQLFALGKEEGLDITSLKGSYAGAMGWGQFMPSSYRQYAVDGDGDGRRDLFNDIDDVIASVANYFAQKGRWQRGGPVMVRALRDSQATAFANPGNGVTLEQTLQTLEQLGYRPVDPAAPDLPLTLITLDGADGPEDWIVYPNFKAITAYNTSRLYATAVYQLSQAIAGCSGEPQT